MARYLETAREASKIANELFGLLPDDYKSVGADKIARLFNFGIRVSPRGVQHTVRLNAVREACKDLPINVSMVEETSTSSRGDYTYHKLVIDAKG